MKKLNAFLAILVLLATAAGAQRERKIAPGASPPSPAGIEGQIEVRRIGECALPDMPEAPPRAWPGGVLPFIFDANVTAGNKTLMYLAMDEWMDSGAEVTFIPGVSSSSSLYVQDNKGSTANYSSTLGWIPFTVTTINIIDWDSHGTVVHELCHAMGFPHEQSRPDRDSFVTINTGNIEPGFESQFEIKEWFLTWNLTGYDYSSVMHYDECAFTVCTFCITNCETITAPSPIGQRVGASGLDELDMRNAYGTRSLRARFVDPDRPSALGTLTLPYGSVDLANAVAPSGSTVYVRGARTYVTGGYLSKGMTLRSFGGGAVTLR